MKQAIVYWKTLRAGILTESDEGYSFVYGKDYLSFIGRHYEQASLLRVTRAIPLFMTRTISLCPKLKV